MFIFAYLFKNSSDWQIWRLYCVGGRCLQTGGNVSTTVCDLHEVFQRVHKESRKIIRQIGHFPLYNNNKNVKGDKLTYSHDYYALAYKQQLGDKQNWVVDGLTKFVGIKETQFW